MRLFLFCLVSFFFASLAFGQTTTSTTLINVEPPSTEEISAFIQAVGGWKGIGLMGGVVLLVQAVMLMIRLGWIKIPDKYKIIVVLGLSLVFGLLGLVQGGVSWVEALVHANTLAAIQVFIHQLLKQLSEPKSGPVA